MLVLQDQSNRSYESLAPFALSHPAAAAAAKGYGDAGSDSGSGGGGGGGGGGLVSNSCRRRADSVCASLALGLFAVVRRSVLNGGRDVALLAGFGSGRSEENVRGGCECRSWRRRWG